MADTHVVPQEVLPGLGLEYVLSEYSTLINALGSHDDEAAILRSCKTAKRIAQRVYQSSQDSRQPQGSRIVFNAGEQVGITLHDAMNNKIPPDWNNEIMETFSDKASDKREKIMIRFHPLGYHTGSSSLVTVRRSVRRMSQPVTKAQLASDVAKASLKLIKGYGMQRPSEPDHESWVIGPDIVPSDIYLTELHRVSKGSWQPVLYYLA